MPSDSVSPQGELQGRVLEWDPATCRTQILAQNLWFPNGVALSAKEDFLVIAETFGISLQKLPSSARVLEPSVKVLLCICEGSKGSGRDTRSDNELSIGIVVMSHADTLA